MEETFGMYHPINNFIFFIGALVFGMFFIHPAFLCASVSMSVLYYLLLKGKQGLKQVLVLLPLMVLISCLNPVFNTLGDTVLFTYAGGRPFTFEALCYGFATAAMFFSILLWFGCYNVIMTSDKFICFFGRFMPAISLVLSMVLRLVPNLKNKIGVISGARKCIGMAPSEGGCGRKTQIEHGASLISALTSWALEGAVVTADSMKSRGYGSGPRTSFSIYRFSQRDHLLCMFMFLCIVLIIICVGFGATIVTYIPSIVLPVSNWYTLLGVFSYTAFLAIPSALHIWEAVTWRISKSRI